MPSYNRTSSEYVSARVGSRNINHGVVSGTVVLSPAFQNIKNGNVVPGFASKIARHEDASSDYLRRTYEFDQVPLCGTVFDLSNKWSNSTTTFTTGNPNTILSIPSTSTTIAADDRALKKLKGKLARDVDQFKLLVPLAELKETRSLIRTSADVTTGLIKTLIDIKHGKFKGAASAAGKAWLQWSFAISPTIQDTHDLLSSISSYMGVQDRTSSYHGSMTTSWSSVGSTTSQIVAPQGGNWIGSRRRQHHDYSVQYTAGVLLNLRSSNSYGIRDHFGLDISELPSVLWELTVFSWVADYFGTMGEFLEDVFSSPPGDTIYCTKSVKYTCFDSQDWYLKAANNNYVVTNGHVPVSQVLRTNIFQRTVASSIPHRVFRFKTADEIGINSVKRLLNLASILVAK